MVTLEVLKTWCICVPVVQHLLNILTISVRLTYIWVLLRGPSPCGVLCRVFETPCGYTSGKQSGRRKKKEKINANTEKSPLGVTSLLNVSH